MTIKEIETEIEKLDAQILPLADRRSKMCQQLIEAKSPFKAGDIITWNGGKRRGRVLAIKLWCCGEPEWLCRAILKDGTLGAECTVHPYYNPQLVKNG